MKVVIASFNPAKIRAARAAFDIQFPDQGIELVPTDVDSGVSDQPFSDSETHQGAINRSKSALKTHPDADFYVGMEGGVDCFNGQLMTFAWMAVLDKEGQLSTARTVTLPLPPAVRQRVESGQELGEANDQVFSTVNSKHEGGAFALLTDGRLTREGVYTETLVVALVPFVNEIYR